MLLPLQSQKNQSKKFPEKKIFEAFFSFFCLKCSAVVVAAAVVVIDVVVVAAAFVVVVAAAVTAA